jgi:hypothetical protein
MTIFLGEVDLCRAHFVFLYHYSLFIMCTYIVGDHCPFLIPIILSWTEGENGRDKLRTEHALVTKAVRVIQAREAGE